MLHRIRNEGVVLRTEDWKTAHSCFLTREVECVRIAVEAVGDGRNEE